MGIGRFITHTMFGRGASDPGLQVSVTPASGGPALAISPSLATNTSSKKGQGRDALGSVEIAVPGTYTVAAGPDLPDAVEPQILLGT